MEKLASRHAITELMSWITLMETIIDEDQDKIIGAVGSDVVKNFLQKYKVNNYFYTYFSSSSSFYFNLMMSLLNLAGFPHRSDL